LVGVFSVTIKPTRNSFRNNVIAGVAQIASAHRLGKFTTNAVKKSFPSHFLLLKTGAAAIHGRQTRTNDSAERIVPFTNVLAPSTTVVHSLGFTF
jgi:hypothetical protein